MYTLSRTNNIPAARRNPYAWPFGDELFRPFAEMVNSPMRTALKETETAFLFDAELPGYEPNEIDVAVSEGTMTISAEHKEGGDNEPSFAARAIRRSFSVDGIDEENIKAQYKNGVLRVTLPKVKEPEAATPRKISVE